VEALTEQEYPPIKAPETVAQAERQHGGLHKVDNTSQASVWTSCRTGVV
jgi:hypothetical protein